MKHLWSAIIVAIITSLITTSGLYYRQSLFVPNPSTIMDAVPTRDEKPSNEEQNQPITVSLRDFQANLVDIIAQSKKSVVSVVATKDVTFINASDPFDFFFNERRWWWQDSITQRQEVWGGSWIYADKRGYIVTNKHVVDDVKADYSVIFADGSTAKVEKARLDPVIDVAVLKISPADVPAESEPASFMPFKQEVPVGSLTVAIGNTLNEYQNSVTLGIISGRDRRLFSDNENIYAWLYQTDTAISQGNSGWPLIGIDGKVIGINTAISAIGNDIGFSIPVSDEFVQATLSSIQENDAIVRPFIGIQYVDIDRKTQEELKISEKKWVAVMEVVSGWAADQAGIKKNDIITAIDGTPIDEKNPFLYQLFTHKPGEEIIVSLKRWGEEKTVRVTLAKNTKS